ncbi:hypothetical protein RND81_04G201700 [Saponaria officinalis]|uniref:Acyl carrier protein n=1 Tax=Saponaria officinalis TaxID=3572 RepID=A0AAW1LQY9_SAPOF
MASIVRSSVSFKASPHSLLNSSLTNKSYAVMPSVSFWRTNVPRMPALRVTCAAAKPDTVEKVIGIVKSQLALKEDVAVSAETKFVDLGADSLDTVEIVMQLEEQFGISVHEENAQAIATIHDAAELIEKLTNEPAA